ncbi:PAS domain S-box protein, partial [Planktothrix sp. FACHB-1355]
FSGDRVELLNLLCTQAAISLENAQLYEREQEKSQSLQASLEKLQKTEVSLAKEREFLNAIIHNITDGIVVCDASGTLTLFNKATREFHGLPVESLPPEQWAEYFSLYQPDGQTPLSTTEIPLFRALQGEIVENAEMVIAPKQGSRRSLLASGQAIFDPWGNKVGAVVVMRDISDRKRAELALQQKSVELEQALHNLQNAQLQIIQSEKMSALGNLVAGVAHEMNNPLGFIAASLQETKPTIVELIEHLQLYQETFPDRSEEILDHAEEIDLEYTLEDLPKIIDSMSTACERLKNISTSLRTFSRADRDCKVPFNIHEGIDSTLLILKHRLKANEQRPAIEVITNYGNLPLIECFPGQLNQVFMNTIANAIDALDESNISRSFAEIKANPNFITITTSVENKRVKIAIADNGCGMTESVKEKIFDHLFTTKAVGKGTGLGLAIARQIIVEKHGGRIDVNSVPGQGTEFAIWLPANR